MGKGPSVEGAHAPFGLVGDSPEIQRVLRIIYKLRNDRCPVLLLGESGTGKELVARALHETSPAAHGPFVAVNAAALSPTLIESELFGHVRGSFTGAGAAKRGLIEQAHGGTLFLDEIGEFPLELQPKLLRALEDKDVRPVGADRAVPVEARMIAATNRDLARQVESGRFRVDLFFRLNVVSVQLPPLRERRGDIPLLVRYFLSRYALRPMTVGASLLECLAGYDWPGNVRELENAIRRMTALCSGDELQVGELPTRIRNAVEASQRTAARPVAQTFGVAPLEEVERLAIEHAIKVARGDRRKAARLLGIGKTTLYRKLREYEQRQKARTAAH